MKYGRKCREVVLWFRFEMKKIQIRWKDEKGNVERNRHKKDTLESHVDTGISLQQVIKLSLRQF